MRLPGTILAVLLLTGCTGSGTPDAGPTRAGRPSPDDLATPTPTPPRPVGTPLPVPVTEADVPDPSVAEVERWLGPPLGDGAPPLEQVLRHLRYETLMQAGVRAPTTARCAGDRLRLAAGATTRCTVAYQGLPVPWTVTIDEKGVTNGLFAFTVDTDRYVVRADVVRAEAWRVWGGYGEETRCARLPAVQVLPAGRTRDRCQHFVAGAWETVPVTVLEGGTVYFAD